MIFSSHSNYILEWGLKTFHGRFLPHYFQFIIILVNLYNKHMLVLSVVTWFYKCAAVKCVGWSRG